MDPRHAISAREHQVLELLTRGLPDEEIARRLRVGVEDVREQVAGAILRSGAHTRDALVILGVVRGIVEQRGTGVDIPDV